MGVESEAREAEPEAREERSTVAVEGSMRVEWRPEPPGAPPAGEYSADLLRVWWYLETVGGSRGSGME